MFRNFSKYFSRNYRRLCSCAYFDGLTSISSPPPIPGSIWRQGRGGSSSQHLPSWNVRREFWHHLPANEITFPDRILIGNLFATFFSYFALSFSPSFPFYPSCSSEVCENAISQEEWKIYGGSIYSFPKDFFFQFRLFKISRLPFFWGKFYYDRGGKARLIEESCAQPKLRFKSNRFADNKPNYRDYDKRSEKEDPRRIFPALIEPQYSRARNVEIFLL